MICWAKAVIKMLHHGLSVMTGHGLDAFIPKPEHWLSLDTLDTVELPAAKDRPLLRAVSGLYLLKG